MDLSRLDLSSTRAARALKVRDLMTGELTTVSVDSHVSDALDLMEKHHIQHLPVVKEGKLAGLVTEKSIRDAMPSVLTLKDPVARRKSLNVARVSQILVERFPTAEPDASLLTAIQTMRQHRASSLPVVEKGALVGIVTAGDLITLLEALLSGAAK